MTDNLNEALNTDKEKKLIALKKIMELEEYNYATKEFTKNTMIEKIRKIIEEEAK